MPTLRELFATLCEIDHPDLWVAIADDYIKDYAEKRGRVKLPADHAFLLPAIESYAENLEAWVEFVRALRDQFDRRTLEYAKIHSNFKTIQTRWLVRRTRSLTSAATEVAIRKRIIPDTPDAKKRYEKRCVQVWKRRRDMLLDVARRESDTRRVSMAERETILEEFWAQIGNEIDNGEVPNA